MRASEARSRASADCSGAATTSNRSLAWLDEPAIVARVSLAIGSAGLLFGTLVMSFRTPFGIGGWDEIGCLGGIGLIGAPFFLLVAPIAAYRARRRRLLVLALSLPPLLAVLHVVCADRGQRIQSDAERELLRAASLTAEPVVGAIERFEIAFGGPPDELVDLVPRFLDELPVLELEGSDGLLYERTEPGQERAWRLEIHVPSGALVGPMLDPTFVYDPSDDPGPGPGHQIERVGDWIWFHGD